MDCPYCMEQIKDTAIVCKHCHRDLFVIRPLMDKLAEASRRIVHLEASSGGEVAGSSGRAPRAPGPALPSVDPIAAMTLTFILLVAAHYIVIVEFSLPLIALRVVSILVPLIFGFLCRESGQRTMLIEFFYGLAVAILSILAMSKIVGTIDHVPVLPRNLYEWREFAEYGASITFGFFTGVILRQTLISMNSPDARPPNRIVDMASRAIAAKLGGEAAGLNVKTIAALISMVSAAASAVTSVVTGLSQFF